MKSLLRKSIFLITILSGLLHINSVAQIDFDNVRIKGPTVTVPGKVETFELYAVDSDGNTIPFPTTGNYEIVWSVYTTSNQFISQGPGNGFSDGVSFAQPGFYYVFCDLEWRDGATIVYASPNIQITVNSLIPPNPNTDFLITKNCGNTAISRSSPPVGVNYAYYWQTAADGTRTDLSQSSITFTVPGPLYLRARSTDAPNNWSAQSQFIGNIDIIATPPPAPPSAVDGLTIGKGFANMSVGQVSNATEYKWYTQQVGGQPVSFSKMTNEYHRSVTSPMTFWVSALVGACESTTRTGVSAIIYPVPVLSASNDGIIADGRPVTISVTNTSYDSYTWVDPTGSDVPGATTGSYSATQPGTYKLRVTKGNSAAYITQNGILVSTGFVGLNENYIRTDLFLKPGITQGTNVDALSVDENQKTLAYFDGLGRPIQSVAYQASPAKNDLVSAIEYDAVGRETKKYLPYADENSHNGWLKKNAILAPNPENGVTLDYKSSDQYKFYNNANDRIVQDHQPYSETILEASPSSRQLKTYGAGQNWGVQEADRSIAYNYLGNIHGTSSGQEKIIAWTLGNGGLPMRSTPITNYVETGGYYSDNQLFIKQTIDESGHTVREYMDKSEKLILKKIQATSTAANLNDLNSWALTYYIYDDAGNLSYVLQPELSKIVQANDSNIPSTTDLQAFAFQYHYDYRNRMSEKKTPGQDWIYMVYNNRDELILTQDGNQRAGSTQYWTFTKYDGLGRPVLTGIKDTTVALSQASMQQAVNLFYTRSWARVYENYIGNANGNVHGYTNLSYPVVTTASVLDVNRFIAATYYDSYDFKTLWPGDYNYQNDALQDNANNYTYKQPTSEMKLVIGNTTGSKIKVLDGGISGGYCWLKSVNYYDDKYRVIQVKADNYKGGIDRTSNLYNFTGNILKNQTTHTQTDVVQWKDLVGVNIAGGKIVRTTAGNVWGTSGIASVESLPANTDGWIEFTASEENSARMIGLSTTNVNAHYTTIDYALYLRGDKALDLYEGGRSVAQIPNGYNSGDIFRIQRSGNQLRYFRNGIDITPSNASKTVSLSPLFIDMAFGTIGASVIDVRSSFTSGTQTIAKRFVYDHAGRLMHEYHKLDDQPEADLVSNEYNELGQLVDKKLHSISGTPYKQSVDYRYNIRGWLTSINDSELTDDENDYFGMNLAYNEEQGTGNTEFTIGTSNQIGAYSFTGNTNDGSPKGLNGSVVSTVSLTADNQGIANQAYAFDGSGYIEIPNSKAEHSFIQNTGKFTITAFLKINDLSARSVILSSTVTSLYKGFVFMYETFGGTAGDHQLRLTLTNGQSGTSTVNLGARNTINDTNWHHVAVVGDGSYIRFYVDGVLDGTPSPITIKSDGDANYTTLIGKLRTTNGAATLGLNGALDELNIFNRSLNAKEIQALAHRAGVDVKQVSGSQYNGNISGVKWSVNQGLGNIKEMAYTFDYDPMNRLSQASHFQTNGTQLWTGGNFHEGELQYDLNGNITKLIRYDDGGMQDNLIYNYGATGATSNQLLKVSDASNKFAGFIDGTNTTNDYSYDANGNMITDLNKGISTAMTYNYLNLPELVTRGVGTARYIYDASGRKLAQVVTSGTHTKRTDYAGEFQYEDDVLQFVNHEEGRIVVTNPELIYSMDGSAIEAITPVDATVTTLSANGNETYVMARATSANARAGMFPIGGAFPVQPGERYKIRVRGYRDKGSVTTSNAAYILAQANGADIAWPGAALQATANTEAWIEQIVTIPSGATELKAGVAWGTPLVGNTIYLNDFEITKLNDVEPEYQYFIKDHLGNVRVTFTTKEEVDTATATLEDENAAAEQGKFIYYDEAIRVYSNLFDHTNNGEELPSGPPWGDPDAPVQDTPGYSTLLRGGANERYGLARSVSVMPGDVIKMEVQAKYPEPNSDYWSDQLRTLLEAIAPGGNPSPGTIIDGGAAGSIGNMTFPFAGFLSHADEEEGGPKAYLNWLVFDRNYKQIDGGFVRVTNWAAENGTNGQHEVLAHELVVKEPGYVYIYLSNENETPVDVFFDDFKVEQMKSPVIQAEDYYPFGLTYNSYQRENSLNQKYQLGAKEKQDELGLNWLDFGARMYAPEIGRWNGVDALSDKYHPVSPYCYAVNNPTLYIDPNGMDIILNGSTQSITDFLTYLSNVTSYSYKWDSESGKIDISKTKGDDEKNDIVSSDLDNLVYNLIKGDQKDKKVYYNLISGNEKINNYGSNAVFIDDFDSGVFDVQDLKDLDPLNEHTNAIIAGQIAHTLKERSVPSDYKSIVDNYELGKLHPNFDSYHLLASIFESAVVESYYERGDGRKLGLEAANGYPIDRGKFITHPINYGPYLQYQFVYPSTNGNSRNLTVKMTPTVFRKRK